MKLNNKWFSIIEILVGIFIFSVWLVSIYILIISTMRLNDYSKNSIVASNLAREGIEIVRNLRDSNYINMYKWNKMPWNDYNNVFNTWVYYKIENDYNLSTDNNLKIDIINDFWEWKSQVNSKMENYRLCINDENIYTYDCSGDNKKTYFYRYLKFDDVEYNTSTWVSIVQDALKLTSKVIWYSRWYHEVEIKTILTDFQKQ